MAEFDLPLMRCGCGRIVCFETLIAVAGLTRLAAALAAIQTFVPGLMQLRSSDLAIQRVGDIWCKITAELLHSLILTVDLNVIILGGGLSKIDGMAANLQTALYDTLLSPLKDTEILCAQGSDASGARGAAFMAWQNV